MNKVLVRVILCILWDRLREHNRNYWVIYDLSHASGYVNHAVQMVLYLFTQFSDYFVFNRVYKIILMGKFQLL